jgi:hypothetical protein
MHIHGSMSSERNSRRMDTFQKMFHARVKPYTWAQMSNQRGAWTKFGTAPRCCIETVKEGSRLLWSVAREAAGHWSSHKDARQSAALALFGLSIGPIIVHRNRSRRPFFWGREAVSGQVAASIKDMLGDSGAKAVQAMLADAGRPREGMLATFLGVSTSRSIRWQRRRRR